MKKEILKKILSYLKKYRIYLILSLFMSMVYVVLMLYLPILTGRAIDVMISRGRVDFVALKKIVIYIVAVVIMTGISRWILNLCNNRMTYNVIADMRRDAFAHINKLPLKYMDRKPTGDIISRLVADADQLSDGLLLAFSKAFSSIMTIIMTLVFMFRLDVKISLVVVLITPLSFVAAVFIARNTHHMFKRQAVERGKLTAYINEMISGQKVVKIFSREEKALKDFDTLNDGLKTCSSKALFYSSTTNPTTRFVNNIVYAGVGVFGALSALSGALSVGELSCFLTYANQYTKPFNEISEVIAELQNALACAGRIFEIIEEDPEISGEESGIENVSSNPTPDSSGRVIFKDVSFSYIKDKPLLKSLSLEVTPGMRVAIVGPTGSGKTTLINLLMRFYDITSGQIIIDNLDIMSYERGELRKKFGMVLQDTWIREGTILENILYGNEKASRKDAIDAAKKTHAHSFIRRLEKGYDTQIKSGGEELSQGQRQLLCITRVMLMDSEMLILDEATSSIDTRTEVHIQKSFIKMMEGKTCFIVAHRLSTIKNSDIILFLKDGDIVEKGSHEQLMALDGEYRRLYLAGQGV